MAGPKNLLLLLASAGIVVAQGGGGGGRGGAARNSTGMGLHQLAVRAGLLFFGTAIDVNNFNDSAYMRIANDPNEFGILVPENSQKWEPTEPTEGVFEFDSPDRVRNLARTNRQQFRCHTLTWFQQLPQFGMFLSFPKMTTPQAPGNCC
jgi:endo-1,4-beta-xylanase